MLNYIKLWHCFQLRLWHTSGAVLLGELVNVQQNPTLQLPLELAYLDSVSNVNWNAVPLS